VLGYLGGGITSWFASQQPYEKILTFDSRALQGIVDDATYGIVDVRNRKEAAHDRITGAQHLPLNQLADTYPSLDVDGKWLIYCAGGYRSMIAASFLRSKGYHFVASLEGGINNLRAKLPKFIEIGQETE
jgi:rhodanese-related sulfurtransferase